jgi:three-Cys-motif partner protein
MKSNPDQTSLPFVGLYDLKRPAAPLAELAEGPRYNWQIGSPLPTIGVHSVAKHEIFERYISAYIATLTRSHVQSRLKLTIVDGFCGGGRYLLDCEEVDGSPLRMLHAVEEAQRALTAARAMGLEIDADFVFVDENKHHIAFLEDQLRQRGYASQIGKNIVILTGKFEDHASAIIDRIRNKGRAHRSLFFLDQYGWSGVKLATIRKIMADLVNPEVVLTFMIDALVNLLCERNSEIRALADLDFSREDVRALIDMKQNKGWKRIIQNTIYKHIQAKTGAIFYTPFFVHPPESHRDYWLLHLAKHHQAREEMGNVFWGMQNTMEHFGGAGFDALGFDPLADVRQGMMDYTFDDNAKARSQNVLLRQIPELIHGAAIAEIPLTKRGLFASSANDTPVVSDIVDAQLAELRDAGEIVIVGKVAKDGLPASRRPIRQRARAFEWTDEIKLSKQRQLFSPFKGIAA